MTVLIAACFALGMLFFLLAALGLYGQLEAMTRERDAAKRDAAYWRQVADQRAKVPAITYGTRTLDGSVVLTRMGLN